MLFQLVNGHGLVVDLGVELLKITEDWDVQLAISMYFIPPRSRSYFIFHDMSPGS